MTDPQAAPPTPAPALPELSQKAAVLTVISKKFGALAEEATTDLREEMLRRHKAEGVKSITTKIGEAKAVSWTVREATAPGKLEVSDLTAFLDYVAANHPEHFEWVPTVKEAFKKLLLTTGVYDPETGTAVNPKTGQVIDGVKWVPSPPPSSIAPNWEKTGAELVMGLLRDGAAADYMRGAFELPGGEG
ncbi:hypothetical protein [Kitasatospora sp. NPDC088548]|uniref:hypothetical protein n=1 Tax=Kitasatospora sp. NPDC088548 TaxID=3364075 RepID=UPI003822BF0B